MKDIHSGMTAATLFGPIVLSADNTPVALDLQGYNAAELILGIGVGGITFSDVNKVEFVLTHSDDDVTYTQVSDADMLGVTGVNNGIVKSLVAAHATADTYRFGYKGNKRYLKLLADFSGTHGAGTPLHAMVVLGRGASNPQADQA